ncbi:hypothetical protein BHM03_00038065, partial [Ensete ventricosum]
PNPVFFRNSSLSITKQSVKNGKGNKDDRTAGSERAMARSSVLLYLSVVVFIVLLLSFAPSRPNHPHRRLKLRSATSGRDRRSIPFDPVIADIERRREDREWERAHFFPQGNAPAMEAQPEWEDFMDAEDYINDEERFNVTDRIVKLFPKIDVGPADGFVSSNELTEWNLRQVEKEVMHRTQRDMELHDRNHDGFISFDEYEPPSWVHRYQYHGRSTSLLFDNSILFLLPGCEFWFLIYRNSRHFLFSVLFGERFVV